MRFAFLIVSAAAAFAPVVAPDSAWASAPLAPPAGAAGSAGHGAPVTFTPRPDAPDAASTAVPADWAGPAARAPGADPAVRAFDPTVGIFGETTMCVVVPGQPKPPCAAAPVQEIRLSDDVFSGNSGNPDSTCQTVETTRMGGDGRPQRVFATVCGDEAEAWSYRQRSAPGSRTNPSRAGARPVGPDDVTAPGRPAGPLPPPPAN